MLSFFRWLGPEGRARLRFVCSDMWKPYMNVIARWAKGAINILDRFHIMAHFSKAIDEVRAGEARAMRQDGYEPILKRSRWCLLKRPENLTEKQEMKLGESAPVQPEVRPGLPAQGGLPGLLGVRVAGLGREVPGPLVHADDALAARADEARGEDAAQPPRADPELVPGSRPDLSRCRGGAERQGESDHQKIVRLPWPQNGVCGPLSHARRASRAGVHPQILLRSPIM